MLDFVSLLGLIALIGIPILIIIYILKPKYQEKTISSTYIWKLSLKYRKRKIPLQWLKKSLLLFMQILIVTAVAFLLCQPFINRPEQKAQKIIILDASASMLATNDRGETRFDRAIDEIKELVNKAEGDAENGVALVIANDSPETVFDFKTEADQARRFLTTLDCTTREADYNAAIERANELKASNAEAEIHLFTDHDFAQKGGVNVKSFTSEDDWNLSILGVDKLNMTNYYAFDVNVANYSTNASRAIKKGEYKIVAKIYGGTDVNGKVAEDDQLTRTIEVDLAESENLEATNSESTNKTGKPYRIAGRYLTEGSTRIDERIMGFTKAEFSLVDKDNQPVSDSFTYDNEFICYDGTSNVKVQVVTDVVGVSTPNYIASAISSFSATGGNYEVSVVEWAKDEKTGLYPERPARSGYDLYIYEGKTVTPSVLPTDGNVWIIDPANNLVSSDFIDTFGFITGANSDFGDYISQVNTAGGSPVTLNKGFDTNNIIIKEYVNASIPEDVAEGSVSFLKSGIANELNDTIFVTQRGSFKIAVWSFAIGDTSFPLEGSVEFDSFVGSLLSYTLQPSMSKKDFVVGESVAVTAKPGVKTMALYSMATEEGEEDELVYTFKENAASDVFVPSEASKYLEVGSHYIRQGRGSDNDYYEYFFVKMAETESNFALVGTTLGTATDGESRFEVADENNDTPLTLYIAIALMALLLLEWGLQYREQY